MNKNKFETDNYVADFHGQRPRSFEVRAQNLKNSRSAFADEEADIDDEINLEGESLPPESGCNAPALSRYQQLREEIASSEYFDSISHANEDGWYQVDEVDPFVELVDFDDSESDSEIGVEFESWTESHKEKHASIHSNKRFSGKVRQLLEVVADAPVIRDPRTKFRECPLGLDVDSVQKNVLEYGLTNFDQPFGPKISARDKVNLYTHRNLKWHLSHLVSLFDTSCGNLAFIKDLGLPALVVDIGCGPATAALALGDSFQNANFRYWGIDSSRCMLEKASELLTAAKSLKIIEPSTFTNLTQSWENERELFSGGPVNVLIVCSYFFANPSIDDSTLKSLASFVSDAVKSPNTQSVNFLYMNSSVPMASRNYLRFRQMLPRRGTILPWANKVDFEFIKLKRNHESD